MNGVCLQWKKDAWQDIEVWDQSKEELPPLDMRELLITDANVYVAGSDMESFKVAKRLKYTLLDFEYQNLPSATELGEDGGVHGVVVWIDPDGWRRRDVLERDKVRKRKFPKKNAVFGPEPPV